MPSTIPYSAVLSGIRATIPVRTVHLNATRNQILSCRAGLQAASFVERPTTFQNRRRVRRVRYQVDLYLQLVPGRARRGSGIFYYTLPTCRVIYRELERRGVQISPDYPKLHARDVVRSRPRIADHRPRGGRAGQPERAS